MNVCAECSVRELAICRTLDDQEIDEFSSIARRQHLQPGQVLQWEGDESHLVGNVIEGVVKLTATTRQGKDQTLGLAYAGDFIGRPFGSRSVQTVTALSEVRVCTFRREGFDAFARGHPDLEHDLLKRTLAELDQARSWMVRLGQRDALQRVAGFLLEMAGRLAPAAGPGGVRFKLPFGRQDIGDLLGLTIETVSRQITALKQDGIIALPSQREIAVLDKEGLEYAAEGE